MRVRAWRPVYGLAAALIAAVRCEGPGRAGRRAPDQRGAAAGRKLQRAAAAASWRAPRAPRVRDSTLTLAGLPAQAVVAQAKAVLENPRLTGEAELRDDAAVAGGGGDGGSGEQATPPSHGFDMGQARYPTLPQFRPLSRSTRSMRAALGGRARTCDPFAQHGRRACSARSLLRPVGLPSFMPAVAPAASTAVHSGPRRPPALTPYPDTCGRRQAVPVAEPEWSAAYRGLCAHVARLLQPAWELPLVERAGGGAGAPLRSRIPADALQVPRLPALPLCPLSGRRQMPRAARGRCPQAHRACAGRDCTPRVLHRAARRHRPIMPSWSLGCRSWTLLEIAGFVTHHCKPCCAAQELEERLRALAAYLREHQARRARRGPRASPAASFYGGDGAGGARGDGAAGPPPAKRQRLEEAAKLEAQRCAPPAAPLPPSAVPHVTAPNAGPAGWRRQALTLYPILYTLTQS